MTQPSESEYIELAGTELRALLAALDTLGEDIEAELSSDILTVEFPDASRFVINSHRAARQIWMAAAMRAWHFSFDRSRRTWIAEKNGDELWHTLEGVLREKLGRPVTLQR